MNEKKLIEISSKALSNTKRLFNIVISQKSISDLDKIEVIDRIRNLNEIIEKESQLDVMSQIVDLEEKLIDLIRS